MPDGMTPRNALNHEGTGRRVYRGAIAHALSRTETVLMHDGGLLISEAGLIEACDHWETLERQGLIAGLDPIQLPPACMILPGFVDMHVHLPQMPATGHTAHNLLAWLDAHIFPTEARFADRAYAERISRWFFHLLLANGTTTAAVFLTSHSEATAVAFETARELGNRVIMGQNLMDKNAPASLIRPAAQQLRETETLCRQWHGADANRLQYAWIPRFAITSSEDLLTGIGTLRAQYPDVYFHTHLSEQKSELAVVREQFPWAGDYTGVYERFGLLGPRSILAHGIHLSDDELSRIHAGESSLAHCPGSNFFLKSGRFRLHDVLERDIRFGLGSDVAAGPELSMFKAMKDAEFMQVAWVPFQALFYAATLGGARALWMDDRIGNLLPGKEADFLIVDLGARPDLAPPGETALPSEATLARLAYLGDDRLIRQTFVRGRCVYRQTPQGESPLVPV